MKHPVTPTKNCHTRSRSQLGIEFDTESRKDINLSASIQSVSYQDSVCYQDEAIGLVVIFFFKESTGESVGCLQRAKRR